MGTRPEDLAARASQLEADADGMRTQNELRLRIDDTAKRIDDTEKRIADNGYRAAQERVDAERLEKAAARMKAEVSGEADPRTGERVAPGERPSGEQAREMWRRAEQLEESARQGRERAAGHDRDTAAARADLQKHNEELRELKEEYEDNSLMDPGYEDAPSPMEDDLGTGDGAEVAALVANEADALGDGDGDAGDALAAQVEMAAASSPGTDPTIDVETPEHPGIGPTPDDPTIDIETPEQPDIGPTPEDPTIDVETPELPDISLPEPEPEPEVPDTGDVGVDFDSA